MKAIFCNIIFSICLPAILLAQSPPILKANSNSIPAKETLIYQLRYKWGLVWLNAGEVTFKTKEVVSLGNLFFEFSASGRTYKNYNSFFKVDDYFEARVEKSTFKPVYFKRNIAEGNYKLNEFDSYIMDSLHIRHNNLTKATPVVKKFPITSDTRDLLSLVYYVRSLDMTLFEQIKAQTFKMFIGGEILNVKCSYLGKTKIEFNKQKKEVIKIGVSLVKGEYFPDGETMVLFVSNDSRRIPLKIESPLRVGRVEAELIRVEN